MGLCNLVVASGPQMMVSNYQIYRRCRCCKHRSAGYWGSGQCACGAEDRWSASTSTRCANRSVMGNQYVSRAFVALRYLATHGLDFNRLLCSLKIVTNTDLHYSTSARAVWNAGSSCFLIRSWKWPGPTGGRPAVGHESPAGILRSATLAVSRNLHHGCGTRHAADARAWCVACLVETMVLK